MHARWQPLMIFATPAMRLWHNPAVVRTSAGVVPISSVVRARRTPPRYVALELIPRDVQRSMENAKDVDIAVVLDEVRDTVVSVEEHSDVARGGSIS